MKKDQLFIWSRANQLVEQDHHQPVHLSKLLQAVKLQVVQEVLVLDLEEQVALELLASVEWEASVAWEASEEWEDSLEWQLVAVLQA